MDRFVFMQAADGCKADKDIVDKGVLFWDTPF